MVCSPQKVHLEILYGIALIIFNHCCSLNSPLPLSRSSNKRSSGEASLFILVIICSIPRNPALPLENDVLVKVMSMPNAVSVIVSIVALIDLAGGRSNPLAEAIPQMFDNENPIQWSAGDIIYMIFYVVRLFAVCCMSRQTVIMAITSVMVITEITLSSFVQPCGLTVNPLAYWLLLVVLGCDIMTLYMSPKGSVGSVGSVGSMRDDKHVNCELGLPEYTEKSVDNTDTKEDMGIDERSPLIKM